MPNKKKFDWWGWSKTTLISLLKTTLVKAALAKLVTFGIISVGGFKAWLASVLLKEIVFDKFIEPLLLLGFQKGKLSLSYSNGIIKLQKLKKARKVGDENKFIDIITSL